MTGGTASTPTGVWLNFVLDRVRSRVHESGIKLDMHKIWHPTYLLLGVVGASPYGARSHTDDYFFSH